MYAKLMNLIQKMVENGSHGFVGRS